MPSLVDARGKAAELRRQIAEDLDPIPTFEEAAGRVHEEQKAGWKNGKHWTRWINTLTTYAFPKLGKHLVSEIEGPSIREVLPPICLSKPETARRHRQRIAAVLDRSYARDSSSGITSEALPRRAAGRAGHGAGRTDLFCRCRSASQPT